MNDCFYIFFRDLSLRPADPVASPVREGDMPLPRHGFSDRRGAGERSALAAKITGFKLWSVGQGVSVPGEDHHRFRYPEILQAIFFTEEHIVNEQPFR